MPKLARLLLASSLACLTACAAVPPPADAAWTVADNYRPLRYAASSGQTSFTVTWVFESKSDLRVQVSDDDGATWTSKTVDTDFTATGAGNSAGGSIVFVAGHCDDSPTGCTAGTLVVIYRDEGIDRTSSFTTLTPTAVDLHLDRQTTQLQQVENIAQNRALQIGVGDDYSGSGFSPVLPPLTEDAAGDAIALKSDLSGFEWVETGDVDGPASSIDNTVARFDGTSGKLLQGSGVTISDANAVAGVSSITVSGNATVGGNALVAGTVAATTVTGANVTSGADPGHTHTGSSIADGSIGAADIASGAVGLAELDNACSGTGNEVIQYASDGTPSCVISGGDVTGSYGNLQIKADAVGASEIAAGAVGTSEIATGAVGTDDLADSAVTASKIATGAVLSDEIANGTISSADFAPSAVDETALGDGSVGPNKIQADTITSAKIVDDTITIDDVYNADGPTENPVLGANKAYWGTYGVTFEGSTSDNFEGALTPSLLTADRLWGLPDEDGQVVITTDGQIASADIFDGTITAADAANGELVKNAGVSGGQTINGGTATTNDLTIAPNSADSTTGQILFGTGAAYDATEQMLVSGKQAATAVANESGGFEAQKNTAATTLPKTVIFASHRTSGTPAVGFGTQIALRADNAVNTERTIGRLVWEWSDATDTSEDANVTIECRRAGADADCLRIDADSTDLLQPLSSSAFVGGSFTWDPANMTAGTGQLHGFTCTGANQGDVLVIGPGEDNSGILYSGVVDTDDVCGLSLFNITGIAVNPVNQTWKWRVIP